MAYLSQGFDSSQQYISQGFGPTKTYVYYVCAGFGASIPSYAF